MLGWEALGLGKSACGLWVLRGRVDEWGGCEDLEGESVWFCVCTMEGREREGWGKKV